MNTSKREHTLDSKVSQTFLRVSSYPPFFLKACARSSIAERVEDGRGSSEALKLLGLGSIVSPSVILASVSAGAIALPLGIACVVALTVTTAILN